MSDADQPDIPQQYRKEAAVLNALHGDAALGIARAKLYKSMDDADADAMARLSAVCFVLMGRNSMAANKGITSQEITRATGSAVSSTQLQALSRPS